MRRPRTRVFIIVTALVILSPVLQARPQECGKPTPPHCKDDCTGKKFYHEVSNKTGNANTCQPCTVECGLSFKLIGTCGGSEGSSCEPLCTRGSFYDKNREQCTGCGICDHTVGDKLCNATHDTICGPCRQGFFHLKDHPGLCHSCDLLSNQQSEPQCQKVSASTTTSFLDTMSTDTSSMTTRLNFTSAAKVETATTDRSQDERTTLMIQMVHTDKGSHLERNSTEPSILEEPVIEDGPPDQVKEESTSHGDVPYFVVIECGSLVGLLLIVLLKWSTLLKCIQQTTRQSQMQNYHDVAQGCIEKGAPDDDGNCNEEKVSIDVRNETAQFQRCSNERDGKCSGISHQKMNKGKTFQDELKPLMTENEKTLDREENQLMEYLKSEAASVAVQCPSLQNLAPNDGTNLGDSDKVSKNGKQCTAKPELEATICVPRHVQTEPVSDMLPSDSCLSADGFPTSANASSAARISTCTSRDKSSTPKAAEPGTTLCKQGEMQTMHREVPDTQAMKWKILDLLDTVVTSTFGKSSAERSPTSLSTNQEASAACSPEKKEKSAKKLETKKLGDGSELDGPDRINSAVPPAISTRAPKCILPQSINCRGNNNNIFVMSNSQYNASCSSSDSDETE